MGILNRNGIEKRMADTDYGHKLVVTPLLSHDQIGPASIDIRLGSSIIVPRRTYNESHDVTDSRVVQQVEKRRYERVRLRYNTKFILHPNELILGGTFEYLSLPADLFCTIASRSSWGRLGLVVATAAVVHPGFKGALTLELVNLSESPITMYPGLLVGQLIFHEVVSEFAEAVSYGGRYNCPTEADPPGFFSRDLDAEMGFWGERPDGRVAPQQVTD